MFLANYVPKCQMSSAHMDLFFIFRDECHIYRQNRILVRVTAANLNGLKYINVTISCYLVINPVTQISPYLRFTSLTRLVQFKTH